MAIPGAKVVSEKKEKRSKTREEKQSRLETEEEENFGQVQHQVRAQITSFLSVRFTVGSQLLQLDGTSPTLSFLLF